jgi:hypothetical protein
MEGLPEFEVRCPSCDVSFPTGTRRCLHCGGRVGKGRFRVAGVPLEHAEPEADAEDFFRSPIEAEGDSIFSEDVEKPRKGFRGRMNAGISLVWIFMAVAFSLMRACGND